MLTVIPEAMFPDFVYVGVSRAGAVSKLGTGSSRALLIYGVKILCCRVQVLLYPFW